jgi:Xaa-Pro aminopeptidase
MNGNQITAPSQIAKNPGAAPHEPVSEIYRERRARLCARLRAKGGGVAFLPTAPEAPRNRDSDYPYRHDSYFYYLTGFTEPQAWLVLDADAPPGSPVSTLFCRPRNAERETWEGHRTGPDAACRLFGFDQAFPIDELDQKMPGLIATDRALHYALGSSPELDTQVRKWLGAVRAKSRGGGAVPTSSFDLYSVLDEMRLIKDAHERAVMQKAADISATAHLRAMRTCRPGMHEYELEAELLYEFRRHGAQAPAYGSIVASGANACILHYPAGNTILAEGDLVLIDAACELDGYASDITRTFPANGRFTDAQRELYEVVLAAQQAAIDATRAGVRFDAPHDAAVKVLSQGMLDLGLLDKSQYGSLDQVLEQKAYSRFYMHRTGHWLGMDVHDCGEYRDLQATPDEAGNRPWRVLQPGMVVTIEPGLYIGSAADVPERFWNTGIRIEDDAVVTPDGCELLTRAVPVGVMEIEALMKESSSSRRGA